MSANDSNEKWTPIEDTVLRKAVNEFGTNNKWQLIASKLPGRSNKSCRKRWIHSLDPSLKRGRWVASEDEILRAAVATHGHVWWKVAAEVKGRTDDQCAKRWKEKLDPGISTIPWSMSEDQQLLDAYSKYGPKWKTISLEFEGRPAIHCRNRYGRLQKKSDLSEDSPNGSGSEAAFTNFEHLSSSRSSSSHSARASISSNADSENGVSSVDTLSQLLAISPQNSPLVNLRREPITPSSLGPATPTITTYSTPTFNDPSSSSNPSSSYGNERAWTSNESQDYFNSPAASLYANDVTFAHLPAIVDPSLQDDVSMASSRPSTCQTDLSDINSNYGEPATFTEMSQPFSTVAGSFASPSSFFPLTNEPRFDPVFNPTFSYDRTQGPETGSEQAYSANSIVESSTASHASVSIDEHITVPQSSLSSAYPCPACGLQEISPNELWKHISTQHLNLVKTITCPGEGCNFEGPDMASLWVHIAQSHISVQLDGQSTQLFKPPV